MVFGWSKSQTVAMRMSVSGCCFSALPTRIAIFDTLPYVAASDRQSELT